MIGQRPARLQLGGHVRQEQRVATAGLHRRLDVLEAGSVTDALAEQSGRGAGGEGQEPFEIHQSVSSQLLGGARQSWGPWPSRDHYGHGKTGQSPADEPEQSQRVRVGPVGIIEGYQERPDRHLAQPMQDGVQAVGGRPLAAPGAQHLATQEGFQRLSDQPEG